MARWWKVGLLGTALIVAVGAIGARGISRGWWGMERRPGTIHGPRLPEAFITARSTSQSAVAPKGAKQIFFGDLHVHTTYSTDAFQWSLPFFGGTGNHPVADACDFARYCSALDFWSITDHAEASTPVRWQYTKDTIRQCQAKAGDQAHPDLVSFIGFEWTQVGRLPSEHFGHKNVIFKDLDDSKVAARPIAASGAPTLTLRTKATGLPPGIVLEDASHADIYVDFNKFIKNIQAVPECDAALPSNKLPASCFEQAATPADLVRKLGEQGLDPLIIPHGSTWGFYTPPGTTWDKALNPKEHPERFSLVEIYSGHGNSEEYRNWHEIIAAPDGKSATCPAPTASYTPSCYRAGEIIRERCLKTGIGAAECDERAAKARTIYANMGVAGHLAIYGNQPEDWLDAGQCTDCFLPSFNFRPRLSVQYGLAIRRFDEDPNSPSRFRWGFIGSSDNHSARPGTGYKQIGRQDNTEAHGAISAAWRDRLLGRTAGKPMAPDAEAHQITQERLLQMSGFQLTEFERQTSFFLTGGLAAVHAESRTRDAIWAALKRREVYATSGPKILLWFDAVDPKTKARTPMGGILNRNEAPIFEVRAVGAFKQKPGCPSFDGTGMDAKRLKELCSGECDNPSDERVKITRIEVVRIRPQVFANEPVDGLIEDKFIVHPCPPSPDGCSFTFSDPTYATGKRDTIYYVRAIEEAQPTINAEPIKCVRDDKGQCVQAKLCFGDYRSGKSDCTAPAEPRAWSSPIYLDFPRSARVASR